MADLPPGLVASTTYGSLCMEMVQSLMDMRSYSEKQGIPAQWTFVPGALVDRARNQAVNEMLKIQPPLQWLLFVDGDCVFKPDALHRLLGFAYQEVPTCDIVGAYNPLRPEPHLPTIDTGTGTWESWMPYSGPVQVMRTGSAFILIKRHVYEKMEAPWYGTRNPMRPIDAMAEVDNWAHQRFDGENPLAKYPEWTTLLKCARDDAGTFRRPDKAAFVGEDSNFCDAARVMGFNVYVQTDVECQHVDRKVVNAGDHQTAMKRLERNRRLVSGIVA